MKHRDLSHHLAVGFAIVFPTVVTWVYFILLAKSPAAWQQTAYGIGKVIQFGFPLMWVWLVQRQPPKVHRPSRRDAWIGGLSGAVILVATVTLFHGWLKPAGHFSAAAGAVREKVGGMGIGSPVEYAALGLFYALGHSLLEEYYWRWYVFGQLRRCGCSLAAAIGVSSVGFMAHHVIVLALFFGWSSPFTALFSLSVAIGGALWAWVYHKTGSLYGPWLSHLLVDAGIFLVGYDLVRDVF